MGAVAHLMEAGLRFDLVGFAEEQRRDHPTLRHVLVVGDDPRGESLATLGRDTDPADALALVERIQADIHPDAVAPKCWPSSSGRNASNTSPKLLAPVGKTDKKCLAADIVGKAGTALFVLAITRRLMLHAVQRHHHPAACPRSCPRT